MKSFEESLAELRGIIEKLETGGVSLEDALADFERGIGIISQCQMKLKEAQKKIAILAEAPDGGVSEIEFDPGDESK